MFVCHSTVIVARQCDVGLDKVSHQQYSRGGWLSGERDTAPGLTMSPGGAAHGCRHLAYSTQLSVVSQRLGGHSGAQALESATPGWRQPRQGWLHAIEQRTICSHAHGVAHAMCLFLALDVKMVPTSLYFLLQAAACRSAGLFWWLRVLLCS